MANGVVSDNKHATSISQFNRSLFRTFDEAQSTSELNLNGRKLREFPRIGDKWDLKDTVVADLSKNRFSEFPRELCTFSSLERLNLYNNVIKSIPEQVVKIRVLKILDLSRNQLSYLPPPLCKLLNLEVLIINNNKLVSLPEEIGQLERLIELDVSCNDITHLPFQIGSLPCLRTLNIRKNMIVELPPELCFLKLIQFDCAYNRIIRLPLGLREMVTLIELNVEHNPLELPPAVVCTNGLLHIMRYLLFEAMKEEKRRGLLTEYEINAKYRNSFSYQGSRHLQCGKRGRKTVASSDSGYLTTEGSEKTMGDDDSCLNIQADQATRNEPSLMLSLADEFSKELARQKADYERKKFQAQQLKRHLLQQLGETETQREKARDIARRAHEEKLALMEKQREDARRKMESRNVQLFNLSSKEDLYEKQRYWPTTIRQNCATVNLGRQMSTTCPTTGSQSPSTLSSTTATYQRSISIDNATVGELLMRSNRAVSVEPNLIAGGDPLPSNVNHSIVHINGSNHKLSSPPSDTINKQFTSSSDTIDRSSGSYPPSRVETLSRSSGLSSSNLSATRIEQSVNIPRNMNGHRPKPQLQRSDLVEASPQQIDSHFQEAKIAKLRYFEERQTALVNQSFTSDIPGFHMQPRSTNTTPYCKRNSNNPNNSQTSPLEYPGANPAFTIRRHLLQAKEDNLALEQLRKTIETRLKVVLPEDVGHALSDGVVLCHFVNQIRPRAVQSIHIHVPSQAVPKLSLAKCRRNVENFIDASRRIGVPDVELCTAQDIIESKNTVRLARVVQLLVCPDQVFDTIAAQQTNV